MAPRTVVFDGTTGSWSYFNGSWSPADAGGATGGSPAAPDGNTQGTIIGATTSAVNGALILESATKALLLPATASPELTILNPVAGMMIYDTVSKTLQVYNGNSWIKY